MNYRISICHPDKEKIDIHSEILDKNDALKFFDRYPWIQQLELLESLNQAEVHYSPSVRFTNTANNISLEMTVESNQGEIFYSLWFERPVMTKIFFGIFGEKSRMKLIEKWGFDQTSARQHLKAYLEENYVEVERIMKK